MSSSHWCYRCNKLVTLWRQDMPMCPECESGFVEEIAYSNPNRPLQMDSRHRRFSTAAAAMYMIGHHNNSRRRHCINNGVDRSNPFIMLRGGGSTSPNEQEERNYFYDDVGNGLLRRRPLPPRMSEFLLGSEFQRIMEQLSHTEANHSGSHNRQINNNHPLPAIKSVVESLPTIQINDTHLRTESHCAVCKEPFELGIGAKEMPCKHIYHPECILPWLEIRNSCPVCRHELPSEPPPRSMNGGLTIWRLPGGGFAVGRRNGGEDEERGLPIVYTEVDGGGFNIAAAAEPRRVSWSLSTSSSSSSRRRGTGLRRMLGDLFRCLRSGARHHHHRPISSSTTTTNPFSNPIVTLRSNTTNVNENPSPTSRGRTWSMDVNSGMG